MFRKRIGVAVYIDHLRFAKRLRRFGHIHYVSKRLLYVVMYIDQDDAEQTIAAMERLPFVKEVAISHRHELSTEFNTRLRDKAKEYDYRMITGNKV